MDNTSIKKNNPIRFIWNSLKIQGKILTLILPLTIVPLVIIIVFSGLRIYDHLQRKSVESYTTLISQVKDNVDFKYKGYYKTSKNMMSNPDVVKKLNVPPYKSEEEEVQLSNDLMGDERTDGGIRQTYEEKIAAEGGLILLETRRHSIKDKTSYKRHITSAGIFDVNYNHLLSDPIFLKILYDKNCDFILAKPAPKTLKTGFETDKKPLIIYSTYSERAKKANEGADVFVIIALNADFLPGLYSDVDDLHFGTMYILDQFNNVMSSNHPSDDDWFDFDEKNNKYILDEDTRPNEKIDGLMSYKDYEMLNTDPSILKEPGVVSLLNSLDHHKKGYIQKKKTFVTHNNKTFLVILDKSKISDTKYIYFHPINQIRKPIFNLIFIIIIATMIIIVLIVVSVILFARSLVKPIQVLNNATESVSQGDYNETVTIKTKDEIHDLGENFNKMVGNIKTYQEQLLSVQREKVEFELAAKIQTSLLPPIETFKLYDLRARMKPATEVGGDYYDFIGNHDGSVWVGIGDVSGHGLISGLIMMMAQTSFNTILLKNPTISTDDLINQVNAVMYKNIKQRLGEDHFMTLSFMIAEKNGTVRYSGAHEDMLVYRKKTKKVDRYATKGAWLGLVPDTTPITQVDDIKLNSGDLLFLYTDGLIEATNKENIQYDVPRLISKLEEFGEDNLENIEEKIMDDVLEYLNEQKDDITFILLRKK